MARYRVWFLADEEDPENDVVVQELDSEEAASLACEKFNDDGDPITQNKLELAVRHLGDNGEPDGPVEMFEVFVDWSPNFTAYKRGIRP